MSMISAQIDELRERSKTLRQGRWSDGPDDAKLMEDAADTIWQLRDDLQRANTTVQDAKHDLSIFSGRIVELAAENAKLRELVARVERARRDLCDAYPDAELLNCEECPAWSECRGDLMDRIRELGVEVDG